MRIDSFQVTAPLIMGGRFLRIPLHQLFHPRSALSRPHEMQPQHLRQPSVGQDLSGRQINRLLKVLHRLVIITRDRLALCQQIPQSRIPGSFFQQVIAQVLLGVVKTPELDRHANQLAAGLRPPWILAQIGAPACPPPRRRPDYLARYRPAAWRTFPAHLHRAASDKHES